MNRKTTIVYTHQVCLHYKVPFLRRLQKDFGYEVHGIFGQSHWAKSKLKSIPELSGISEYKILPTIDLYLPLRDPALHLFWNPTLHRELRRIRPDVIITGPGNFPNNLTISRFSSEFRVPYVWHGIGSIYSKRSLIRHLAAKPLGRFFKKAAGGLAFNTKAKDFYVENYGVNPEDIDIAINVVDTEKVKEDRAIYANQVDSIKEQLGIGKSKVILFVGRVDPEKRLDELVRAYARVRENASVDSVLLVVGDGTALESSKRLCSELGIKPFTRFVGAKVDDANLYYMLGDIFVMPGLGGLAISQAMAHGIPTITAPADGTELDLVDHGRTGFLLAATDRDAKISDYILKLLEDEQLAASIGRHAKQSIDEQNNIGETMAAFDRVVRKVTKL